MQQRVRKGVPLTRPQSLFRKSDALFRAFIGGRGTGKSWIGAYDLARRAKRGRTYLIASPTGILLSDTTFPTFREIAKKLGTWRQDQVRMAPYPTVVLSTGATIRFRTAEDPEHLRGPNLSGVWLDEGSLMDEAAYLITIACLREGGDQGWMTLTATPKGRQHWTYNVFGAGKANTFLVKAKTKDNPFLPRTFYRSLSQQYTSLLAAQELEGEFLDTGGTMFRRSWFGVIENAALPPMAKMVRSWDLASTPKTEKKANEKANDPDWTAGVLMGRDAEGVFYILDIRRIRGTPQQVQALIKSTAEQDGRSVAVVIEQEPGSSGVTVIDHYLRLLAGYNFRGERSTGDKATRAQPLAAQAEGGRVKIVRGPFVADFLNEVESFPFGKHDDQVDAASRALSAVTIEKRSFVATFVGR